MKINFLPQINFTSKRETTRKADDILRKAKSNFPIMSPTYIDGFYLSRKDDSMHFNRASKISNNIEDKIDANREAASKDLSNIRFVSESPFLSHTIGVVKRVKKSKVGNCGENCRIGIAAFAANDVFAHPVSFKINSRFFDKKTSDTIVYTSCIQDHSFFACDMDEDGKMETIVDPWLGFADSLEGAQERLKSALDDSELPEAIPILNSVIYDNYDKLYNCLGELRKNVGLEHTFSIVPNEKFQYDKDTYKKFGDYVKYKYPELILDKDKK